MIRSDQAINVHRPQFDLIALRLTQSGLPGNISPRGLLLGKLAKELIACHGVLLRISRVRESQQGFVGQPCEGLAHERFTASEEARRAVSKDCSAGSVSFVAVLRDARKSALLQDEVD